MRVLEAGPSNAKAVNAEPGRKAAALNIWLRRRESGYLPRHGASLLCVGLLAMLASVGNARSNSDCILTVVRDSLGQLIETHNACPTYYRNPIHIPRDQDPYMLDGGGGLSLNAGNSTQVRDAGEKPCDEQSGNPVMLGTGNKIESELDFAQHGEMGLHLRRTYNHHWNYIGLFGKHWVSSLDYSLVRQGPDTIWAQRPDGRRIKFNRVTGQDRWNEDKAQAVAYILLNADQSYTLHSERNTTERYDSNGYVRHIQSPQGVGWTFNYVLNYLIEVVHDSGSRISMNWSDGRLIEVRDPDGNDHVYAYSAHAFGPGRHRLAGVTRPGSPATTIQYHYENPSLPGALTGKSYGGERFSTFQYDPQGRVTRSEHAGGVNRYLFAYQGSLGPLDDPPHDPPPPGGICDPYPCIPPEPPVIDDPAEAAELARRAEIAEQADRALRLRVANDVVIETNPLGKQAEYRFEFGKMTRVIGAASPHCAASYAEREYNVLGYPRQFDDFNGNATRFTYNNRGQVLTRIEGHGTPQARTFTYLWDEANNRIQQETVEGDHSTTYSWWPDHRLQSVVVRNRSANGTFNQAQTTHYHYTHHANGLMATMTVDGPVTGSGDAVTYTYDTRGRLLHVRDDQGRGANYSDHNGFGQPRSVFNANTGRTDYQYDALGRVTRMRTFRGGAQQDTSYTYNPAGLLASISDPDGVTVHYTYDEARRPTVIAWNEPGGTVQRRLFYDAASNLVRDERWRGARLFSRVFIDYDELDRPRALRGNDGQRTVFEYDTNHNLVKRAEVLGQPTRYEYDSLNRLTRQIDPNGGSTRFLYDAGGRLTQVIDPRNRVTSYAFDGFGQLWSLTSPDSGTTSQQWNSQGLRTSVTRADGVTETIGHDSRGRVISRGPLGSGQTHVYTWDACLGGIGRICRIVDPHQSLDLGYTPYGELSSQTATVGGAVYATTFRHDALGRLDRITYPGNVRADYTWSLGRIIAMSATINGQTRSVLDGLGWIYDPGKPAHYLGRTYGNGGQRRDYVDLDGRLYSIVTDLHQGFRYGFDSNDRLTALTNFAEPASGLWSQTFGYDDRGQLTSANSAGLGNQGFWYDANGNRTRHTRGGGVSDHVITANSNRLNSTSGFLPRSYTYKATGQVTAIAGPLGGDWIFRNGFQHGTAPATTLTYDPFNRLSGISGPGVNAGYKIAATGLRVEKTANGRSTRFVYDLDGRLLYERDLALGRDSQHLYLDGQPVVLVRNGTLYYVLPDHLGRPEVIVDQNRSQVWRATLSAFERRVIRDQIGGYHLGFPGQYHDAETGFAYNVHRDYDPATGRYLQSDPIGLDGGLNTYTYAGNDPILNIDPEGLFLFSLNELKRGEHYIPRDLAYQIHMTPRVLTAGATLTMSGVYAGASLGPLLPEVGASLVRACQSEPVKKVAFATCVTIGLCTSNKQPGIGQFPRDMERMAEVANAARNRITNALRALLGRP